MAAVMQKAVHLDEDTCLAQQEYVSRLEAENQGLRDLLMITNGHLGSRLSSKNSEVPILNSTADDSYRTNETELSISPNSESPLT